jgi:hypothetical protein
MGGALGDMIRWDRSGSIIRWDSSCDSGASNGHVEQGVFFFLFFFLFFQRNKYPSSSLFHESIVVMTRSGLRTQYDIQSL